MYKIIIVDDDFYVCRQIKEIFDWKKFGFTVTGLFRDGNEALNHIERNPVDAALSDIKMPGLSGLELAKILSEKYPHIVIALTSAYRDFEYARQAIRYNVTDYITKPVTYEKLRLCVQSLREKAFGKQADWLPDEISLTRRMIFLEFLSGLIKADALDAEMSSQGMLTDTSSCPCSLLNLTVSDFKRFIMEEWKYGIDSFYSAVCRILNAETDNLYATVISFSFNTIEIFAAAKLGCADYPRALSEYTENIIQHAEQIFKIRVNVKVSQNSRNIISFLTPVSDNSLNGFRDTFEKIKKQSASDAISQNEIIKKATEYIDKNFALDISLNSVAAHINLHPVYFSKYFKQYKGENFVDYINRVRIEKAVEFLKSDKEIKIYGLGDMCGFRSNSHFYKIFKLHTGLTPAEYKKNN